MQGPNQMDLVNNTSNDLENLPLLSTKRFPGTYKNKYIYLRYLARIATPINDSINGYLATTLISAILSDTKSFDIITLGNPLSFAFISCLNEIRLSVRVSSKSCFVIGSSDFEHIRLFMSQLKEILGELHGNEYNNLKQLKIYLEAHGKYEEAKILINDFKLVSQYNFMRRQADDFSNYLMSANIFYSIFYSYYLNSMNEDFNLHSMRWRLLLEALAIATPIWLSKILPDIMEENWSRFENWWQRLPGYSKKGIIGIRNSIKFLFNAFFAFGTELMVLNVSSSIIVRNCGTSTDTFIGNIYDLFMEKDLVAAFAVSVPPFLYALSQLLPYFNPGCIGKISKNAKRGMYALFRGLRTMALLIITLISSLGCFERVEQEGSRISIDIAFLFATFAIITGLLVTANDTLNYKPANVEKMNVIANTTLRELENGIAGDLNQETTSDNQAVGTQTAQNNSWNKSKLFSFWKQPSVKTTDTGDVIRASGGEDVASNDEIVNIVSTRLEHQ